jgi:predicted peroxiredoxin
VSQLLVVKLTWGPQESPERVSGALTVAATALESGIDVSCWLISDAVPIAQPGVAEKVVLPHATALAELRDSVVASGTLTVCSQCAARRSLTGADLLPGVRIAGTATFVEEITRPQARALVY